MNDVNTTEPAEADRESVQRLGEAYRALVAELGKVIVGQRRVLEDLLTVVFAGGHCLLQGVPGLAKTLMVRTLAETLDLSFNRIQFTPDLMPADITGTDVIQEDRATGSRTMRFLSGPVFANVLLADEINRTPPKTQAALLEAMQEHQVTAGGARHKLPDPFFVLATQNPIEQEGTYPLPEAQLDRFMFEVLVDYPSEEEEFELVRRTTGGAPAAVTKMLSHEEVARLQQVVRRLPVADHVIRYAMHLARATRKQAEGAPDFIKEYTSWGAGPRASQYLILGAKARAMLAGRTFANTDDVRQVAAPVLRHRILTNFNAEADGVTSDEIVRRLVELIPADSSEARPGGRNSRTYFDPRTLAKLAGLDLKARRIVEGYVSGLHRSPFSGFSVEFAEHREYAPGDDIRYLDWKLFGKSDRYYLKRFEEETNFACQVLLDASESMRYQSAGAACSKLEYAKLVAAAVGYLVVHQQDAIGLATFDTAITHWLNPSSQPAQLKQLVHVLEQTEPRGDTAIGPILHEVAERISRRGLVLILSDLFDDPRAILSGLKHFRHRRHDVTVLQVIDPAEQDFPFDDAMHFRGLEGGGEQSVEPRTLKRAYQAEFEAFLQEVARGCRDLQIDYVLMRTDRPLDAALRSFLVQRRLRAGRS